MATNFLLAAGTNGYVSSLTTLMTTELNALASGGAATSSVGGSSGVFTQSSTSNGIWANVQFTAGGASTPTAGGYIAGWFLLSLDGNSTIETAISTPSTTVLALPRTPDFIIPFDAVALTAGNIKTANGLIRMPFGSYKLLVQNLTGAALSATGHTIKAATGAVQY